MRARTSFIAETTAAGLGATLTTTAAMAAMGRRHDATPWAPINAVSHIFYGDEAADHVEPSMEYTAAGALLNAGAMFAWAGVYAMLWRAVPRRSASNAIGLAAATAALAYIVDYHVVPARLTPGFEKRLRIGPMAWIYGALAVGLAAGSVVTAPAAARPRA
jgi:hypothetical protein